MSDDEVIVTLPRDVAEWYAAVNTGGGDFAVVAEACRVALAEHRKDAAEIAFENIDFSNVTYPPGHPREGEPADVWMPHSEPLSPWGKAKASGLLTEGAEWSWRRGDVLTVVGPSRDAPFDHEHAQMDNGFWLHLKDDGTISAPDSWSCLRPTPEAPRVGDEMVTATGHPFTVASWEYLTDLGWEATAMEGGVSMLGWMMANFTPKPVDPVPVPPQSPLAPLDNSFRCRVLDEHGERCLRPESPLHENGHDFPPPAVPVPVTDDRPEWALLTMDGNGDLNPTWRYRMVLAGHLKVGDVILWSDVWLSIKEVRWVDNDGYGDWIVAECIDGAVQQFPSAALVAVRLVALPEEDQP